MASIAAIGGLISLLILICALVLAIALLKAQHKKKIASVETPSTLTNEQVNVVSVKMQGNELCSSTSRSIYECHHSTIKMESKLTNETVKNQENDTGIPTYQNIEEHQDSTRVNFQGNETCKTTSHGYSNTNDMYSLFCGSVEIQGNKAGIPIYQYINKHQIRTNENFQGKEACKITSPSIHEYNCSKNMEYCPLCGAVEMQGNAAGKPNYQNIDEHHDNRISEELKLASGTMKAQGYKASIATYENADEFHASTINTKSNPAYEAIKTHNMLPTQQSLQAM